MITIQWRSVYTGLAGLVLGGLLTFLVNGALQARETKILLEAHLSVANPLIGTLTELKTFNDQNAENIKRIPKIDSVMQGLLYEVKAIRLILEKGK